MNPSRGELEHIPVLKTSVLDYLITDRGGTYVDCTIGGGGHAQLILEQLGESGVLIGLDLDAHAVEVTQRRLSHFGDKLSVFQTDFSALKKTLEEHDISDESLARARRKFGNITNRMLMLHMGRLSDARKDIDIAPFFQALRRLKASKPDLVKKLSYIW